MFAVAAGAVSHAMATRAVCALLVHALNDRARQFYEHYGFRESPQHPMTLMLRLNTGPAQNPVPAPSPGNPG